MADTALAIPGLFLTCVEYFKLARLSRDFPDDFGSCLLQLRASEMRLYRWGKAAGITDGQSETFVRQLQDKHTPKDIQFAYFACKDISKLLSRAKDDSQDIMDRSGTFPEDLDIVDELERLKVSAPPEVSRANRALKHVKSGYERSLKFTNRAAVRGQWALYRKAELTALVNVIGEQVSILEKLFPQEERQLAAEEATSMEADAIKVLAPITAENDPILAEALKGEAPRKGFTWEKVVSHGNAVVHLGHHYRNEPEREGHTRYGDVDSGDNATVHLGNYYGYETVTQLRSAYGTDRPPLAGAANPPPVVPGANRPPVVPNAMNDPNFPFGKGHPLLTE